MELGEVRRVVTCTTAPANYASSPLYTGVDGVFCVSPQGALLKVEVIDVYVLSPAGGLAFEASVKQVAEPFDTLLGSQFFLFGFVGVATLYLACHGIGLVLKMVRNH